jgi:poly-gamma-glutamate synthesis protein (capsule biosynthesis protein)
VAGLVNLFLAGDVMTGRGVDQVLPHPSSPELFESYVRDARTYVEFAEQANGPIEQPAGFAWIWGDALSVLRRAEPDARIVNLETSVTRSDAYWEGKGINYRMHPDNVACLTAAELDCCGLANNHVLDWGFAGLEETLATLQAAGLRTAGAGRNAAESQAPAIIELGFGGRVLVFAFGSASSGIPGVWAAGADSPGINLLPARTAAAEAAVAEAIAAHRRPGDFVVASIHWGGNWGYEIPPQHRALAHGLIERAGVDVVHGHSSHHAKGIEIHNGRPIIYGCGDFINDYEGISGYPEYRSDLRLAYLVELDAAGAGLRRLRIVPFQARRLRLQVAAGGDVEWVLAMLERECAPFGVRVERRRHDMLHLSSAELPGRT